MATRKTAARAAREDIFIEEYARDMNAARAARAAGYSDTDARVIGYQMLKDDRVAARVREALAQRREAARIDAGYVLKRLAEIDQMDVADLFDAEGNIKPVLQWPKIWRQFLTGVDLDVIVVPDDREGAEANAKRLQTVLKKIKWPDKVKNLELLGRHLDVGAWRDNLSLTGKGGGPIHVKAEGPEVDLSQLSQAALDELMAARKPPGGAGS